MDFCDHGFLEGYVSLVKSKAATLKFMGFIWGLIGKNALLAVKTRYGDDLR
jgi:hypothetical protein